MGQSKEPIRLCQRRTPSGLISLYLVPEKTRADKEKTGKF